jgi:hypothetical protein
MENAHKKKMTVASLAKVNPDAARIVRLIDKNRKRGFIRSTLLNTAYGDGPDTMGHFDLMDLDSCGDHEEVTKANPSWSDDSIALDFEPHGPEYGEPEIILGPDQLLGLKVTDRKGGIFEVTDIAGEKWAIELDLVVVSKVSL